MPYRITFKDRDIQNPILRFLAACIAIIGGILAVIAVIILIAIAVVTSPIWLLIDLALKHYGLAGFVRRGPESLQIGFDLDAFRKPS